MKTVFVISALIMVVACNSNGDMTKANDSTEINLKTSSPADGGPNNGLGDSNTYNRANDTIPPDSMHKK